MQNVWQTFTKAWHLPMFVQGYTNVFNLAFSKRSCVQYYLEDSFASLIILSSFTSLFEKKGKLHLYSCSPSWVGQSKTLDSVWDGVMHAALTWSYALCACYRGFSCDIISSIFFKSSYRRPPCWFPLGMGRYWEKQQNVIFSFVHTTLRPSDKNISALTQVKS